MRKTAYLIVLSALFLLLFGFVFESPAKEKPHRDEITEILQQFKNYRYGAVNVYEVKETDELKEVLKSKAGAKKDLAAAGGAKLCLDQINQNIRINYVRRGVDLGKSLTGIINDILNAGLEAPEMDVLQCVYNHYQDSISGPAAERVTHAYIVTMRPKEIGAKPDTIIGLVMVVNDYDQDSPLLNKNLKQVAEQDVYSLYMLKDEKIDDSKFGYKSMYELLASYFIQGNVQDKTMEARSIGTDVRYFTKKYGNASSIISNDSIGTADIQKFKQISEGQPENFRNVQEEIVISPDLLRWSHYDMQYQKDKRGRYKTDSLGNRLVDTLFPTNSMLPLYGLELRYGIDDINFYSFFSERMTLSALWESVKLGVILPTDGWASLTKDIYDQDRKLTHGGVGLAGVMDFPLKVIPDGGIFHFSFGVVSGDAKPSFYKPQRNNIDPTSFGEDINDNDYLIRANAQLHYTFGIKIDNDYLFRFGIGGTVYNVEYWYNKLVIQPDLTNIVQFTKLKSETVGGISGRIEFMSTNITTPFGMKLQYFDESLSGNIWLQIPVIPNMFSVRLDAQGYVVAFSNTPHPWESRSIFLPTVRCIFAL